MKNLAPFLSLSCLLVGLTLFDQGCKKDDNTTGPTAPTNSFSFNSDDGNFAASGAGVGWMAGNIIAAYNISSPTNMSVATIVFGTTPAAQSYTFPNQAGFAWMLNVNPNDSATIYAGRCVATHGSITLSAQGGGTSRGTFSGSGMHVQTPTDTCAITNGAFTIYITTAKASALPPEVERVARRMIERADGSD